MSILKCIHFSAGWLFRSDPSDAEIRCCGGRDYPNDQVCGRRKCMHTLKVDVTFYFYLSKINPAEASDGFYRCQNIGLDFRAMYALLIKCMQVLK